MGVIIVQAWMLSCGVDALRGYHRSGMHALGSGCTGIIVRPWMLLALDALVPWTLSGKDTPGSGRTGGIDVIIVRALMLLVLEAPVE